MKDQMAAETDELKLLRRRVDELENRNNYLQGLYENSPLGYQSLDENGNFIDVNRAWLKTLGYQRQEVIGRNFSEFLKTQWQPHFRETFLRFKAIGEITGVEFEMLRKDGTPLFVSFHGKIASSPEGHFHHACCIFYDITEQRWRERQRESKHQLLHICHMAVNRRQLMGELIAFFRRLTGCEAVGVRLRQGEDFPYYQTTGFPETFVKAENSLCSYTRAGVLLRDCVGNPVLECMCGNIIGGRFDPSLPFFTEKGSFWTNSTSELLAATSEADRQARTRNRCNGEGYESVALIPLRLQETTFGLFQFNDPDKGRFTPAEIELLENLVAYIAIALAKTLSDEKLLASQTLLNATQALTHAGGWEWDTASQTITWTDETFRIHGINPNDRAPGSAERIDSSLCCYNPEDRPKVLESFQRCVEHGIPYDLELPFTSVDGRRLWIRTTATAVWESGRVVKVQGNLVDITQRRRDEELLRAKFRLSEISATLNLKELLRNILDEAETLTNSSISSLHFFDADQQAISLQAWSTATTATFCKITDESLHSNLYHAGVWADSIRSGLPLIHNDYMALPNRRELPPGHAPVVRELVVPVLHKGRVAAIMAIANKESDYTTEDTDLLSSLAILAWDIVLRKRAETDLQQSEEKYRNLYHLLRSMCDNVPDMIWAKDLEQRYIFANKALCRTLLNAADTDEPLGQTDLFFAERERSRHHGTPNWHTFGELCQDSDRITTEADTPMQFDEFGNVQGRFLFLDVRKAPFVDDNGRRIGTVGSARDITEHKRAEEDLHQSLAEKEVLLREVHHRVKNNMAAIIGLFDLQRQAMDNAPARMVLAELSNRVRAMSLVHEKLYRSRSLSHIDFQDYSQSLISHLRTSFGSPHIRCEITAQGTTMPLDLAVPCGMIINELVTNALKHAFPDGQDAGEDPCILVALTQENDLFTLTVADNGMGFAADFDWSTAKTLGLTLVKMLGRHQLGGHYQIDHSGGTRFTLAFSPRGTRRNND